MTHPHIHPVSAAYVLLQALNKSYVVTKKIGVGCKKITLGRVTKTNQYMNKVVSINCGGVLESSCFNKDKIVCLL